MYIAAGRGSMDPEHQDGIVEKYILAKGKPESIGISIVRLARFMAEQSGRQRYDKSLWNRARYILRGFLSSHYVEVDGTRYIVQRVEAWPDYKLFFEIEGIDNG